MRISVCVGGALWTTSMNESFHMSTQACVVEEAAKLGGQK